MQQLLDVNFLQVECGISGKLIIGVGYHGINLSSFKKKG
jgi:hypothetical protein